MTRTLRSQNPCPRCDGRCVEDDCEAGNSGACLACGGSGVGPAKPTPQLADWQKHNASLPTPDMIRFAYCGYFALVGASLVTPNFPPDDLVLLLRHTVRENPRSFARILAIKAYRAATSSTLDAAKEWVDAHPECYDLRIVLPNEA
jgi:hypothetical protein